MYQRWSALGLLFGLLLSHTLYTRAGLLQACLPCCFDDSDTSENEQQGVQAIIASAEDPDDDVPTNLDYRICQNRPIGQHGWKHWAPEGGWACDQSKVDFPTVECLAADMRSCGNVGPNTVFYSFGAGTHDARDFRDTLHPQGTMFNDAIDFYYMNYVINPVAKFGLSQAQVRGADGMNRHDILTARLCQALASTSSGSAYLVVKSYGGDPVANQGGLPGIFQRPLPGPQPNQWTTYELGTLQQNVCIIISSH